MAYRNGPKITTDGLVLCLDAAISKSYPGSGTSWIDLSTNKKNATLANSPSYSSVNKGFFSFDGTNEKAYTSTIITPSTGDFTACFAYQLTGTGGRGGLFERKLTSPYNGWSLGQGGNGNWSFTVSGTSDFNNRISVTMTYPTTNTWYVDCAVYENGNSVTTYRNGEYTGNTTGASQGNLSSQGTPDPLKIASRDNSSIYLPCKVAYVMIYNKALSSDEVRQNFNATRGRFGV
jgi:hypothetical protein